MSTRINVCLVSANSYPLFNDECNAPFGGAELQISLLAKYLAQDARYLVTVIVGDFGQDDDELRHNVKLVKAHSRSGRSIDKLYAPYKIYRAIRKVSPDVLIQRASGPETGICAFYARNNNIKFIYSVAHDAELVGESVASHHPIYRHLYDYGVKKADIIVVQSKDQMRALAILNENLSRKAVVISNSIELRSQSEATQREHVLWIARAQRWKQPEIFIELANALSEETFVMIMPVEKSTKEIDSLVEKAHSIENLQLISSVDFNLSQGFFNKAKILVNTSSWEGFPNTFLQAGVAATPIVSLEVDPDSFIRNTKCGFVCDGDVSMLLDNVRFLLENDEASEEAGRNCQKYVMKNHDIQKNIKIWKNLIN